MLRRYALLHIILVAWLAGSGVLLCCGQVEAFTTARIPLEDPSAPIIRKQVQEVKLILAITDRHRHLVKNLSADDIAILDNGLPPEQITYFEPQTQLPLRVALVIDRSDSVSSNFAFEKSAAKQFLSHGLRNDSDLAIIVEFNDIARVAQGPTSNRRLLSHVISKLPSGGNTSIYDAIVLATQQLGMIRDTQPSRRAIILITDGSDTSSHTTLAAAVEVAQQNETIVYVLRTEQYWEHKNSEQAMQQLSELTGGDSFMADTDYQIERAFSKIQTELRSQYAIAYRPTNIAPDGSFHQISVLVPRELIARYRHGYFAR